MNLQNGKSTGTLLAIVVVLFILGAGWYFMSSSDSSDTAAMEADEMMMEDDTMTGDTMMKDGEEVMEGDAMMEDDSMVGGDAMIDGAHDGDAMMETSFNSAVIAGSSSPLLEFDQRDYETAITSGRVVALYFYANWCPTCKAEFPIMEKAFNGLTGSDVVGFRVHFNDNQTTKEQEALAREFGVAYQHTKVFVQNGERILKSPESWDLSRYQSEINNAVN